MYCVLSQNPIKCFFQSKNKTEYAYSSNYFSFKTNVKKKDIYDMSDEDAKTVVDFVEQYKDKRILVHCDAGISRSSAVAAAILKHYTGNDDMIFDSRWYNPNRWVYRKVLEAFESEVD